MPGQRKWLTTFLVVALATIGLGASAVADSGSEQGFLSAINSSRASQGLAPLQMDGGLQSHARNHTADMIASGGIYHSTSAELQAAAGSGWTKLGENVGRGGSVSSLHQAFMNSSGHKKNILGDYNYVGIGTDSADGVLWVTVVFMKKGGGSPPAPTTTTAPQPAATTGPSQSSPTTVGAQATTTTSTTTTTLPPTTTTTLIVGPDKPVIPGESCIDATRFGWTCHD
jgi:hypothetical protein